MNDSSRHTPRSLTAYLAVADARSAIAWYGEVFGAEIVESELYEMDDGRLGHATLSLGSFELYVSDEFPELGALAPNTLDGSTVALVLSVPDVDSLWVSALNAGAQGQREPTNQMGFRSCWFLDPWGHRWSASGPEVAES